MGSIIDRALDIINDHLKDQTSSFQVSSPLSAGKAMARGGHVLEDDYPTHYLPNVGRQVMADGGTPRGFEGRVMAPEPEAPDVAESPDDEGMTAYHGSPHEFDEFDIGKIGTGEGAQAYGHGLYFAENEDVARNYRNALARHGEIKLNDGNIINANDLPYGSAEQLAAQIWMQSPKLTDAKYKLGNYDSKYLSAPKEDILKELELLHEKGAEPSGHMYEVRLNAGPEHLLDWDKPLSEQQAYQSVRQHWDNKVGDPDIILKRLDIGEDSTGQDLYEALGGGRRNPENASKALSEMGVRGIRYLDAGSRGKDGQSGSHNIVIFDPQHIKVKRRYAEGGEVPDRDDEGVIAYAFGNSVPHIEKRLAAYHGSPHEFDMPKEEFSKTAAYHYLADSPETAKKYGKNLYKSEIHPKNLIEFDPENIGPKQMKVINELADRLGEDPEYLHDAITGASGNFYGAKGSLQDQVMHELKDMGHDAVRFPDVSPGGGWDMSTVVLDPSIIRKFERQERAYGGAINPLELRDNNLEDEARRLILWSYAVAPLGRPLARAEGGAASDPVDKAASIVGASAPANAQNAVNIARNLTPMGFYSAAAEAASKIPQRAPIDQIINKVKGSPNVKAEELDWSGVRDAFAGQKSVDPAQVAQHLQANLPQIQETVYGYDPKTKMKTALKPRYQDYTIPGGQNYREVLLGLPETKGESRYRVHFPNGRSVTLDKEHQANALAEMYPGSRVEERPQASQTDYRSAHWDQPNVLGHIRMSDRTGPEGEKILHLEELQSDWGQAGRKKGFALGPGKLPEGYTVVEIPKRPYEGGPQTGVEYAVFDPTKTQVGLYAPTREEAIKSAIGGQYGVPVAPYVEKTQNWVDLGLKRALKEAAEGGYSKMVWTPGEEQAARYNLSHQVNKIEVPMVNPDGTRSVRIDSISGSPFKLMIDKSGKVEGIGSASSQFSGKTLDEVVGKEIADKIMSAEKPMSLEGEGLNVGGEGMKGFYDNIVPSRLEKLIKKLDKDAKIEMNSHDLPQGHGDAPVKGHVLHITPKLRAAILKGLPAYEHGGPVINRAFKVLSQYSR